MKTIVSFLLLLGVLSTSFAQDENKGVKGKGNVKVEELPEVVIKRAGTDFSVYLPDKNSDPTVRRLQEEFIAYDLGPDYEGYENYLVVMELDKGVLSATYNEKGKLISVVENYKNVKLPSAVIYKVYIAFPGWRIVNDKFLYSQREGDIIKKQYNLKIRKGKDTKKIIVNSKGDILD
jgi:hypothetical protein